MYLKRKVVCYQLDLEKNNNNLVTFQLNAPVINRVEVKKHELTLYYIYSHALLRIRIIGGQWSLRIAPPNLYLFKMSTIEKGGLEIEEGKMLTTCAP